MTVRIYTAEEMPESDYHADPCRRPSFSASCAKDILRAPIYAHRYHPRLGGVQRHGNASQQLGTAAHSLLLGVGTPVERVEVDRWATNAAKDKKKEVEDAGRIPLKAGEYDRLLAQMGPVYQRCLDHGIDLQAGERETTIIRERATEHGIITVRSRLDHIDEDAPIIHDVKTVNGYAIQDEHLLWKQVERFGYHIQRAAYVEAVEDATMADGADFRGRVVYRLIFVHLPKTDEPPVVKVCQIDEAMSLDGQLKWERACNLWAQCTRDNHWPDVPATIDTLDTPSWYEGRIGTVE